MCQNPASSLSPVDALSYLAARISFINDAFSQSTPERFSFSTDGQFGLNLFLHDLHAEAKRIEDQLSNYKEVRS